MGQKVMFPMIKTAYLKEEDKRGDLLQYSSVHMTNEKIKCIDTESGHKIAFTLLNISFSKPCSPFPQLAVQLVRVLTQKDKANPYISEI